MALASERPQSRPARAFDDAEAHHVGTANNDGRRLKEFSRARKSSRRVRLLKIGLPIIAVTIILVGVALTWLARSLPDNLSVASASFDDGRVVMQDPRMSGLDSKNRPYQLIAERAFQSLKGGGVDLEKLSAKVAVNDDTDAEIKAASGHYDQASQNLTLAGGIGVQTTSGINIKMASATIDFDGGNLDGQGPVMIKTPNQSIEASSLTVSDGGKILSFGGRVKMRLNPSAVEAELPATDQTPPEDPKQPIEKQASGSE